MKLLKVKRGNPHLVFTVDLPLATSLYQAPGRTAAWLRSRDDPYRKQSDAVRKRPARWLVDVQPIAAARGYGHNGETAEWGL